MIVVNLSPYCETSLGFDGVSSLNSYLPKFQTRIGPSQYKTQTIKSQLWNKSN